MTENEGGLWSCEIPFCYHIYNPKIGDPKQDIPPGTAFEDLPEDWKCPKCGVGKKNFRPYVI